MAAVSAAPGRFFLYFSRPNAASPRISVIFAAAHANFDQTHQFKLMSLWVKEQAFNLPRDDLNNECSVSQRDLDVWGIVDPFRPKGDTRVAMRAKGSGADETFTVIHDITRCDISQCVQAANYQ